MKLIVCVDDALNDANDMVNYEVYEVSKVYDALDEVDEVYDALDDQVGFVANDEINKAINYVIDR